MTLRTVLLTLPVGAILISTADAEIAQNVVQEASFHFSTKTPSGDPALNSPPDPNGSVEQSRYCLPRELTLLRVIDVKASRSNERTKINIDPDLQASCLHVSVSMPPPQQVCTDLPRLSGLIVKQTKVCQFVPTQVSFVVSYEAQKLDDPGAVASSGLVTPETDTAQGDWRASKLVGLNVYNENNEKIGSINDLLTDKNGSIKTVVIGVGGFLGMGEHLVAVTFDRVKFSDVPIAYPTSSNSSNTSATATTTGAASSASSTSTAENLWYPDHALLNANKDELKAIPEFKYSKKPSP